MSGEGLSRRASIAAAAAALAGSMGKAVVPESMRGGAVLAMWERSRCPGCGLDVMWLPGQGEHPGCGHCGAGPFAR